MAMLCRRSKSQSGSHSGNTPLALAEGWSPPSMVSSRWHSQVECTSWSNWQSIFLVFSSWTDEFFIFFFKFSSSGLHVFGLSLEGHLFGHLEPPLEPPTYLACFGGVFFSRHSGEDDWPSRGRARQRKRLDYLMQLMMGEWVGMKMKNVYILLFTIMIWDFSRKQLQLWVFPAVAKRKIFNLDEIWKSGNLIFEPPRNKSCASLSSKTFTTSMKHYLFLMGRSFEFFWLTWFPSRNRLFHRSRTWACLFGCGTLPRDATPDEAQWVLSQISWWSFGDLCHG